MIIIVKQRNGLFHANLKDKPGVWGVGKTIEEAIGSLITGNKSEEALYRLFRVIES